MTRVQAVIDTAIDRVVSWIAGMARRVGAGVRDAARGARASRDSPAEGDFGNPQTY